MAKVLIVDDERLILKSYIRLLGKIMPKNDIFTAESGEEALKKIPELNPGIIISDHRMPGMEGYDFLEKVKELYPAIKTVLMSGTEHYLYGKNVGKVADAFTTKPLDEGELEDIVRVFSGLETQ